MVERNADEDFLGPDSAVFRSVERQGARACELWHAKQHAASEETERLSREGLGREAASIPGGGRVVGPYVGVGLGEVAGAGGRGQESTK
jgi:hypothetical protein